MCFSEDRLKHEHAGNTSHTDKHISSLEASVPGHYLWWLDCVFHTESELLRRTSSGRSIQKQAAAVISYANANIVVVSLWSYSVTTESSNKGLVPTAGNPLSSCQLHSLLTFYRCDIFLLFNTTVTVLKEPGPSWKDTKCNIYPPSHICPVFIPQACMNVLGWGSILWTAQMFPCVTFSLVSCDQT